MTLVRRTARDARSPPSRCSRRRGATRSWTVKGHGFGHGVGLSQYGAFGFAEHGRNYKRDPRPLLHATRSSARRPAASVRVLLGSGEGSVGFSGAEQACGEEPRPRATTTRFARRAGGRSSCATPDGDRIAGCGGEGKASSGICGSTASGRYRGSLVAAQRGGDAAGDQRARRRGLRQGRGPERGPVVVAGRSARAQAVVARSYGLATDATGPFDHYDDTRSQVYGGRSSETKQTNRAVEATTRSRSSSTAARPRSRTTSRPPAARPRTRSSASPAATPRPVPEVGRGPLRRRLAGPHAGPRPSPTTRWSRSSPACSSGRLKRIEVTRDRQLAADRPRPGRRHRAARRRSPATRCARGSACARPGRGSSTADSACSVSARRWRTQRRRSAPSGKAEAEAELEHLTQASGGRRSSRRSRSRASSAT